MEQSKELSKLLHTTVQDRGEISAQSGNDDAEALRHLTTVIRGVSGWLMVSVKKARNLHDDTAGPFERATIHENFKPGVEHHRMHEITPPQFHQPAGPLGATIHENFKPGVEHHRMHEITPQPTPLPAMDPQFDGLAVEHHRMHEISSPPKSTSGTRCGSYQQEPRATLSLAW